MTIFSLQVLELVRNQGFSISQVCRDMDLEESPVRPLFPRSRNTLIRGELNVIGEILRGADAFVEMANYPADEMFDGGAAGQPGGRSAFKTWMFAAVFAR